MRSANEVDLVHPFCAQQLGEKLVVSGGNVALDVLQSYLDSMVELGRRDNTRLGMNLWSEWKFHTHPSAEMGIMRVCHFYLFFSSKKYELNFIFL